MTRPEPSPDPTPPRRLACFSLAEHGFALQIADVREAVALRPITPLPLVPEFVRGIMNLRGEVVAVLDLLPLLGLASRQIHEHGRVVIARHGTRRNQRVAGLLADEICGVIEVDHDAVRPAPATVPPPVTRHLSGVISRPEGPLLLLDVERIINSEKLRPLRQDRG